jgi:phosphoribosylaminoimidazole-succinocarboxamide synthase
MGEHDEPISYAQVVDQVGAETAAELRRVTLAVYTRGAEIARERGIILADTKIELGWDADGVLTLGDEVLTPDSSRFWPADEWQPGRAQPSFDKQYVRDWLTSPESGWDKNSTNPPPRLPDEVVMRTRQRYLEAYERITGTSFTG